MALPNVSLDDDPISDQFSFLKGSEDVFRGGFEWGAAVKKVREHLSEAMNARHVAFLFGSGCSSHYADAKQVGIPTMQPLAREFTSTVADTGSKTLLTESDRKFLEESLGIDLKSAYSTNLECLMETLHSFRFAFGRSTHEQDRSISCDTEKLIRKLQRFLLERCIIGAFSAGDDTVVGFYEAYSLRLVG